MFSCKKNLAFFFHENRKINRKGKKITNEFTPEKNDKRKNKVCGLFLSV